MTGRLEREVKLLLVFFLRIALFAGLLVLGSLDAALVLAFLAGFLGLVAAALSAGAQGSGEKREGAGDHREHLDALHMDPIIVLQDIAGVRTNTMRHRAPGCPIPPVICPESGAFKEFCK